MFRLCFNLYFYYVYGNNPSNIIEAQNFIFYFKVTKESKKIIPFVTFLNEKQPNFLNTQIKSFIKKRDAMFYLPLLNDELFFPPPERAHSSGLLAAGGDLSIHRLILAYSSGIFPWFDAHDPFLWWSPDPRFVLFTKDFKLSKRQERAIRQANFIITANTAFDSVIEYCARVPRNRISTSNINLDDNLGEYPDEDCSDNNNPESSNVENNTWITRDMIQAYKDLFEEGFAHSVEVWQKHNERNEHNEHDEKKHEDKLGRHQKYSEKKCSDNYLKKSLLYKANTPPIFMTKNQEKYQLVGGLYGVRMGHIFCGESMFHLVPEASRAALVFLIDAMKKHNMPLLDSQQKTPHIERMGGQDIPRKEYLQILREGLSLYGTAPTHSFPA